MPTVEVQFKDLEDLVGAELPSQIEEFNRLLNLVKSEASGTGKRKISADDLIRLEVKDGNRADLWSVEGIARALRGFMGIKTGLKTYRARGPSNVTIKVESALKRIRPFIGCAVVRQVNLSDTCIRSLVQLQEKLDQSYGRRRTRSSIGFYDFDLIKPPLVYGVAQPSKASFVPLEFTEEMTLEEMLEKHPKGLEYGHIVKEHRRWPLLYDSSPNVLSLPPIINSNDLGRITEETQSILIEVTGTSHDTVLNTLTIMVTALADRGGRIYSTRVLYPYGQRRSVTTPRLVTQSMRLRVDYVNQILGLKLSRRSAKTALRRARFGIKHEKGRSLQVVVPCYRLDVMHPVDLVEDIAIAYDINRVRPRWPRLVTVGSLSPTEELRDLVREIMIGLGFQEVLTFSLTNPGNLFTKMNMTLEEVVEVENPMISTMTCLRPWLLPSLMELLSHNTGVRYPQKVFEVGDCVLHDEQEANRTRDVQKLASVTIHGEAGFTEMKSALDAFFLNMGGEYEIEEASHPSLIEGRAANILVNGKAIGFLGEIHPRVLEAWGLENPAAAFELELPPLFAAQS